MDPKDASSETEWLEVEGHFAVPLPLLIYPTVERWVPLLRELATEAEEHFARCLQAIVDDEINAALSRLEQKLVKEVR